MSGLSKIGEGDFRSQSLNNEEDQITKILPFELLENILSYLDALGMQLASCVNKLWNKASVHAAKHREFYFIKNFSSFLKEKIDPKDCCREIIENVIKDKLILKSITLNQVKSSIFVLKEQMLKVLQVLNVQDLKRLENDWKQAGFKNRPLFFEEIFDLARVYKKMDETLAIANDCDREEALRDVAKELSQHGNPKKALEIAQTIINDLARDRTLKAIAKQLARRGNPEKAIQIAVTISDSIERQFSFMDITNGVRANGIEKSIGFAYTILNNSISEDTLKEIGAMEWRQILGVNVLRHIAEVLAKSGNPEKAQIVTYLIPSDLRQSNLTDLLI